MTARTGPSGADPVGGPSGDYLVVPDGLAPEDTTQLTDNVYLVSD